MYTSVLLYCQCNESIFSHFQFSLGGETTDYYQQFPIYSACTLLVPESDEVVCDPSKFLCLRRDTSVVVSGGGRVTD